MLRQVSVHAVGRSANILMFVRRVQSTGRFPHASSYVYIRAFELGQKLNLLNTWKLTCCCNETDTDVCRNEGMTIACGYMLLQGSPTIRKHLIQSCTFPYDVPHARS